jgi:hypothetical protein
MKSSPIYNKYTTLFDRACMHMNISYINMSHLDLYNNKQISMSHGLCIFVSLSI